MTSGKNKLLQDAVNNFIVRDSPWYPRSYEQLMAYTSPADELFYGGRAGGGKTDLLLGLAGTAHIRSIIYRRIYPNLEGIEYRGKQIFGEQAWNGYRHSFELYRRRIQLAAMQFERDKEKYRGRPNDFYGFDEICEFLYTQYIFVTAWNRTTVKDQRCRIVCAGNPPTDQNGAWVIDYWAPWLDPKYPDPAQPGELRWFVNVGVKSIEVSDSKPVMIEGEEYHPSSRTFIPAEMISFLKNTNYERKLRSLPEPLRSQLLKGDFTLWQQDDQWQVIPSEWVRLAMERWRHMAGPPLTADDDGVVERAKMTCAGVDVARGGRDYTVIAPRYSNYMGPLIRIPGKGTPDGQSTAGEVIKNVPKGTRINIDVIGVGSSPYDYLCDYGYNVVAISVAETTDETDIAGNLRFVNLRSRLWWNAREMLDPDNNYDLALPDDKQLFRDLTSAHWHVTARGIAIEKKDEIKKRIGRSPDDGDAVVMALYDRAPIGII